MKTTGSFSLGKSLVYGLLAASLFQKMAAGSDIEGKFKLPFEARWGSAILPPGDYTFSIESPRACLPSLRCDARLGVRLPH